MDKEQPILPVEDGQQSVVKGGGKGGNEGKVYRPILLEEMSFFKFAFWSVSLNFFLDAALYPLSLVKTRLQVQSTVYDVSFPRYRHTGDAVLTIIKKEGLRGLFKGFWAQSFGCIPTQIIYYLSYEASKSVLYKLFEKQGSTHLAPIAALASGALAEAISGVVWIPLDAITQRLQIQGSNSSEGSHKNGPTYRGGWHCFTSILKEEGVTGLYRGYMPAMISYVPSGAVSWAAYEYVKTKLFTTIPKFTKSLPRVRQYNEDIINFVAGFIAGALGGLASNPADLVKTRLQTDSMIQKAQSQSKKVEGLIVRQKYQSAWHATKMIFREEGLLVFWQGGLARMIYYSFVGGCAFGIYEVTKRLSLKQKDA
eukprot:TRINITY_DN8706_c0_g1_i1.p1 TRINITY_DN8706_c0_g1~~TRINITY_DN8706_c0_g1_i1.p1  ORF type:complete len:367 (-),score=58.79 TRINITY_DN8706_c0_g1_i1:2-1102(-)